MGIGPCGGTARAPVVDQGFVRGLGLARRPLATSRANASASLSRASSATTRFITPAVAITVAGTCSDVSAHPMARALAARSATR